MSSHFAEALAATIRTQPELDWMTALRTEALRRFDSTGFPTLKVEDWRHTDLREYARRSRELAVQSATEDAGAAIPAELAKLLLPGGVGLVAVFRAGRLLPALSQLEATPGVSISRLGEDGQQALWSQSLEADTQKDAAPMPALNAALLGDGIAIEVAAGTEVAAPIYVVHASAGDHVAQNRVVLRLGAGSHCTLIEHHLGEDGGISNSVIDIICERDAQLGYIRLQDESTEAQHVTTQRFHLAANAGARLFGIDLGGGLVRNTLEVNLEGDGAEATAHGFFHVDGKRHVDNLTRIDHKALNTTCFERYRGIAEDSGQGVFNGKIIVHEGADGTSAALRNENLLLSAKAEIDTKPELEIYTDDVKAAHGATTGELDETAIFYLQSRGIGRQQARQMLMAAFASEIIALIPVSEARQHVIELLSRRLPDLAKVSSGQ